jgi:hypothetical protein
VGRPILAEVGDLTAWFWFSLRLLPAFSIAPPPACAVNGGCDPVSDSHKSCGPIMASWQERRRDWDGECTLIEGRD